MKSNILKLVILTLAIVSFGNYNAKAGIDSEFEAPIISQENYQTLSPGFGVTLIPVSQFKRINNTDADDGYYKVNLPFTFTFNNVDRNDIWICVNGFATFETPLNLSQDEPMDLFAQNNPSSHPNNVLAPFWGDHYYRSNEPGYTNTNILVSHQNENQANERFVIEWKNLNINDEDEPSSVGSFQLILYKSQDENTRQGDIEFAYGLVNTQSGGAIVKTDGASIGIRGEAGDYVNGLCYDDDPNDNIFPNCDPFAVQTLSSVWQPSGGSNFRIRFNAFPIQILYDTWGDGDTDLSHGEFGVHFGRPQNRFVTFNDVRKIMRSVVTQVPLDSVRGREAYHADVDHDGRFYSIDTVVWNTNAQGEFIDSDGDVLYYNSDTTRDVDGNIIDITHTFFPTSSKTAGTEITPEQAGIVLVNTKTRGDFPQRSRFWADDRPTRVTSLNQIHFQADEHDAYWIIDYLAVKIPSLPWIYEWKDEKGKLTYTDQIADNISFGEPIKQGENKYKIPVYSNGVVPRGFSSVFEFDTEIKQIEINQDILDKETDIFADFHENRTALVGTGLFDSDDVYAYIYVETDKDYINVSGARFNKEEKSNAQIVLNSKESIENVIDVYPNPVTTGENSKISVNVDVTNYYSLEVFDVYGNQVTTIFNGEINAGLNEFSWNGLDNTGNILANGTYIVRLSNPNFNAVTKIILSK